MPTVPRGVSGPDQDVRCPSPSSSGLAESRGPEGTQTTASRFQIGRCGHGPGARVIPASAVSQNGCLCRGKRAHGPEISRGQLECARRMHTEAKWRDVHSACFPMPKCACDPLCGTRTTPPVQLSPRTPGIAHSPLASAAVAFVMLAPTLRSQLDTRGGGGEATQVTNGLL
jgi:hypothetical protein